MHREEEALEEAEMIPEAFQQKQLLKERASMRTQQLMEQMQSLPDDQKEVGILVLAVSVSQQPAVHRIVSIGMGLWLAICPWRNWGSGLPEGLGKHL